MLSENRQYDFVGELTIKRSRVFKNECLPKDDEVNWLFLNTGDHRYSFIYRMAKPLEAIYGKPFKIDLAFLAIEIVKDIIQLNKSYEVLRGEEPIGTVKIISAINN